MVRYFDDKWMPFARGGYSENGDATLDRSLSLGIGIDVVPEEGLLGIGFNWGRPNPDRFGSGLSDQYTVEVFYRAHVTGRLTVTPDLQLIKNPALNPAVDTIWVLGLRARLAI